MAERSFNEKLKPYKDASGHEYCVDATLVEGKRPVVSISTGGDVVTIDVADWQVVKDCVERAIENVGDHPDNDESSN